MSMTKGKFAYGVVVTICAALVGIYWTTDAFVQDGSAAATALGGAVMIVLTIWFIVSLVKAKVL